MPEVAYLLKTCRLGTEELGVMATRLVRARNVAASGSATLMLAGAGARPSAMAVPAQVATARARCTVAEKQLA